MMGGKEKKERKTKSFIVLFAQALRTCSSPNLISWVKNNTFEAGSCGAFFCSTVSTEKKFVPNLISKIPASFSCGQHYSNSNPFYDFIEFRAVAAGS